MADYITPLVGVAATAAAILADKKKKEQLKADNLQDTAYNIKMQEAEKLGAPGAQYLQEAHNALVGNQRIDRTGVDYGQALGLLGKGIAGNADSIGKGISGLFGDSASDVLNNDPLYNAPGTVPDLYTGTLNYPAATGNSYQLGGDLQLPSSKPSVASVGGDAPQLTAPDWGALNLSDLEEKDQ